MANISPTGTLLLFRICLDQPVSFPVFFTAAKRIEFRPLPWGLSTVVFEPSSYNVQQSRAADTKPRVLAPHSFCHILHMYLHPRCLSRFLKRHLLTFSNQYQLLMMILILLKPFIFINPAHNNQLYTISQTCPYFET